MLRNLLVGLGNALRDGLDEGPRRAEAVDVLVGALGDPQPLVRGHAVWALGQAADAGGWSSEEGVRIQRALREHQQAEADPFVLDELERAGSRA